MNQEEKKCECELDGFLGAVTAQNCPIHSTTNTTMEERFNKQIGAVIKYGYGGKEDTNVTDAVLAFITEERRLAVEEGRKQEEEKIKIDLQERIDGLDPNGSDYEKGLLNGIKIIAKVYGLDYPL